MIPVLAQRAASEGPRWTRAVGIIPATPYLVSDRSLRPFLDQGASLGEEAVLADSGRAGEVAARVGRLRRTTFLSILQKRFLVFPNMRTRETTYAQSCSGVY